MLRGQDDGDSGDHMDSALCMRSTWVLHGCYMGATLRIIASVPRIYKVKHKIIFILSLQNIYIHVPCKRLRQFASTTHVPLTYHPNISQLIAEIVHLHFFTYENEDYAGAK